MKSLFEQMGGTYTQQGDYFLPDLKLPSEEERPIGVWGQRRLRYLREHRPILYINLKTSGQLQSYLADVEEQANALFLRLVRFAFCNGHLDCLSEVGQVKMVQDATNNAR